METMIEDGRIAVHLSPEWLMTNGDAPLSLTASDGTGLRLHRLSARGHIQDPLALTELTLTFDNPEDRELEGRFEITLPPGAAVSRIHGDEIRRHVDAAPVNGLERAQDADRQFRDGRIVGTEIAPRPIHLRLGLWLLVVVQDRRL